MITRRLFALGIASAVAAGRPRMAAALGVQAARQHVEETIEAILELIVAGKPRPEIAARLKQIIEEKSALPQLAKFVSGSYWHAMNAGQRQRFIDALGSYLAQIYAGYFRAYDGTVESLRAYVAITGAEDAGAKGIVVTTELRPVNEVAIPIIWLVSDRSGAVAVSDLSVGGISMALTQRDIVQAMFEARDGDPERMIASLREAAHDLINNPDGARR
jgi:phospholipid transport system substrate-binding protein